MRTGIYKITSPTGRVYVGQSKDIDRRWENYRRLKCQNQKRLLASFKKYGVETHFFEVVELCEISRLDEMEVLHGLKLDCLSDSKGLNLKLGSTCRHLSDKTRSKMSDSAKLARLDPAKNANMVNAIKKHFQKTENRDRNRAISRGRTDAVKMCREKEVRQYDFDGQLISVFKSLKVCSVELGLRQGNISSCCNGKYISTGGFVFRFGNEPFDKYRTETDRRNEPVIVKMLDKKSGETLKSFCSMGDAERNTGISKSNIQRAISGKLKSAGGFKWSL